MADRHWLSQGVRHCLNTEVLDRWLAPAPGESRLVLIGRQLPRDWFEHGFAACAAP